MSTPKTWAQQAFDRLLSEHLSPLMKQSGYKKTGANWRIRREEEPAGWGVVNLQKSQWGSRDEIRFTINLAVRWDCVPWPVGIEISARGPAHYHCHVHERLGFLQDDPGDLWWEIDGGPWSPGEGPDCLDPVVASLIPLLRDRGLPWVYRNLTDKAAAAAMQEIHAKRNGQPPN